MVSDKSIDVFIENNFKAWLDDTKGLLRIPSFRSKAEINAPYGKGPKDALLYIMDLAERDGFDRIKMIQDKVGEIEIGPKDAKDVLGVLVHIDVMPVNDLTSWQTDPFEPTVREGKLIARGSDDMKSSTMLTYYALKYIKDQQIELNKRIKLIFGTDEESDWDDMTSYFSTQDEIITGFSPDGDSTITTVEKGILEFAADFQIDRLSESKLRRFTSGAVVNSVPGSATAMIALKSDYLEQSLEEYIKQNKLNGYQVGRSADDLLEVTLLGEATHASTPEQGKNAATYLANFLLQQLNWDDDKCAQKFLTLLGQDFHQDPFGEKTGYGSKQSDMGQTTQNIGVTDYDVLKGSGRLKFSYRYVPDFDPQKILQSLNERYDWINMLHIDPVSAAPHIVDSSDPIVTILSDAYETVMGKPAVLITGGGATYGRLMKRGVAFGPKLSPTHTAHEANEYFPLADYQGGLKLMILSLQQLATQTL